MVFMQPFVHAGLCALAFAAVLASCDRPPALQAAGFHAGSPADVQQALVGTWLREDRAGKGLQTRRLLVLAPDGQFSEQVRVIDPEGEASEYWREGTWLYDGMNLKRRYTVLQGQLPTRLSLPFATFQISFPSRHEFVGVDHVHRNRIAYRRVPEDTRL